MLLNNLAILHACCSVGADRTLLSVPQVVPEAIRTSVYAFDKCIIGAIGALTTPLAGLLAQKVFGFTQLSKPHKHHAHAPATAQSLARIAADNRANLNNARALENGLMITLLVPMVGALLPSPPAVGLTCCSCFPPVMTALRSKCALRRC